MSKYYFNRDYSLTIGRPASVLSTGFEEAVFESGKAKTITGLRITFDIKKTETPESNSCTITINNLSDSTRKFIKARTKKESGMIATLKAGYEELHGKNLPTIFTGDISNVYHDLTPPEVVTTIECNEGKISIEQSYFSKSYRSGVRVRKIIDDILSNLGLSLHGSVNDSILPDYTLFNGFSFSGWACDALTRLCNGYGLLWSIQNNSIKIYPAIGENGQPGTDNSLSKLMLVGSPKRINNSKSKVDEFIGYELISLLAPEVCPGGKVNITSRECGNVTLGVSEVYHRGDNWGTGAGSWNSTIRARDL